MSDTEVRAADADRAGVAERLRRAHADGRIDLLEYDERLAAAYAAKTYGELAPLTADLPPERPGRPEAPTRRIQPDGADRDGSRRLRGHALALRIEWAAWVFASAVNLLIWGIVCVATASAVYPWWIWVAGPWGLVLLARVFGERLRARAHTRF